MTKPQPREECSARAAALQIRNQAFVDGRYVDAASGKTFDCISPIDGRVLCKVSECGIEDVNRAVTAARNAFEKGAWSEAAPVRRKKTLIKFAQLVESHRDELALLESLDMGKPVVDALSVDVAGDVS